MIFKYPYTDLYNLNLDWVIQAIKEVQETITNLGTVVNTFNGQSGDVTLTGAQIETLVGGIVKSFNGRSGAVELTEADVNATLIDIVWTSDPGEVIEDLSQDTLNDLFAAGRRVLIFNNALGEPDRIYFLTLVNDTPTPQQYVPTGAIAGVASVNGQTGAVVVRGDTIPVSGSDNTTVEDALAAKEDVLTFDSTPTAGSTNPVTSDGIQAADAAIQTDLATLGNTVSGIDNRLESAEQGLTYAETDIDTLSTQIGALQTAVSNQSQQIDEKADIPITVTITVDSNGASMSGADQAKLTADMVMCWYSGDRSKLTSNLSITPAAGSATVTGTASSSTTFTIAFIHSTNGGGIASVITSSAPKEIGYLKFRETYVAGRMKVFPVYESDTPIHTFVHGVTSNDLSNTALFIIRINISNADTTVLMSINNGAWTSITQYVAEYVSLV